MNKENKEFETRFIPCGDSMEKMEEINEDILESVSGGVGLVVHISRFETCPKCGGQATYSGTKCHCGKCGFSFQ